jgi:hypothetical protein
MFILHRIRKLRSSIPHCIVTQRIWVMIPRKWLRAIMNEALDDRPRGVRIAREVCTRKKERCDRKSLYKSNSLNLPPAFYGGVSHSVA